MLYTFLMAYFHHQKFIIYSPFNVPLFLPGTFRLYNVPVSVFKELKFEISELMGF